jgi:hypothetical protein
MALLCLPIMTALGQTCMEGSCTSVQGAYISHFTGPDCNGEEYYYTPYFGFDGVKRSWDGKGVAGTLLRSASPQSWRYSDGTCFRNAWPTGNPLDNFVRIYRDCGEATCTAVQGSYISHFTAPGCKGGEYYYTPYFGFDGVKRSWDGGGRAGTVLRKVTAISWRDWNGDCWDEWPGGHTLTNFVRIYRPNTGLIP